MIKQSTKVAIRPARLTDATILFKIRTLARRSVYPGFLSPAGLRSFEIQNAPVPYNLDAWRERVQNYIDQSETYAMQVAIANKRPVGWSLLKTKPDEESTHLMSLYVDPAYQGLGIGAQLLNDALGRTKYKRITLTVIKANKAAVGFYERHGFTYKATTKYAYLGAKSIKMEKWLG